MALKMENQKSGMSAQLLTEGPTTQTDLQKLKKEAAGIKDSLANNKVNDSNKAQFLERINTFISDVADFCTKSGKKVSDAIDMRDLADFCNRIQTENQTTLPQVIFDAIEGDMIKNANPVTNEGKRTMLEELVVVSNDSRATEEYFSGLLNRMETGGYLYTNALEKAAQKGYTYLYENTVARICEKGYVDLGTAELGKMMKNGTVAGSKIYDDFVRIYQNTAYSDNTSAGLQKATGLLINFIEGAMSDYRKNPQGKVSYNILKGFAEKIGQLVPNEIRQTSQNGATVDSWINQAIPKINLLIGNRTSTESGISISNLSVVKVNLPLTSFIREALDPIALPTKTGYLNAEFRFIPPQEINAYTVGRNQSPQFSDAFAKGFFAQKTGQGVQPGFGEQVLATLDMSSIPKELFNNPQNLPLDELRGKLSQFLKSGDLIGAYGMLNPTGELYGSISSLLNSAKMTYMESYLVNDVALALGNKNAYDQIRRVYEGRERDPNAKWMYISGVKLGTSVIQQKTIDVTFDQNGNPLTSESKQNLKEFKSEMGILFNINDFPLIVSPGVKYAQGDKAMMPTIRVQQPVNGIVPIEVRDAYLELKK
ncbi:MAG TPA: hypothetical protein PLO51_00895, partial [Candidatus Micrarchaeota archaeon]|nr:hypothetical protein [Candidatus Micrarchaeota archaeon]